MQWNIIKSLLVPMVFLSLAAAAYALTETAGKAVASGSQVETDQLFKDMGILPIPPTLDPITFDLDDLNGKSVNMRDFRGKIVFLNFWTTWCPACIVEMPAMEKLHQRMYGRPFTVVGVNLQESAATVKRFMGKNNLSFMTMLDTKAEFGRHLGIRQIPTTFIINGDGTIIGTALGPRQWDSGKAVALFEHLIENKLATGN